MVHPPRKKGGCSEVKLFFGEKKGGLKFVQSCYRYFCCSLAILKAPFGCVDRSLEKRVSQLGAAHKEFYVCF